MIKSPLIIWEKWTDPILSNITNNTSINETELPANTEDYGLEEYEESHNSSTINKYPIVITPMGILPYNEKTACDTVFNFWLGHTNFSISKSISDLLEETEGVETLDIFTRYRFRIGIGKAFKDSKVMRNINSITYEYINERHQ